MAPPAPPALLVLLLVLILVLALVVCWCDRGILARLASSAGGQTHLSRQGGTERRPAWLGAPLAPLHKVANLRPEGLAFTPPLPVPKMGGGAFTRPPEGTFSHARMKHLTQDMLKNFREGGTEYLSTPNGELAPTPGGSAVKIGGREKLRKGAEKPWYSYGTWTELIEKGGEKAEHACRRDQRETIANLPPSWELLYGQAAPLLELDHETAGIVNVVDGTPSIVLQRPSPVRFGSKGGLEVPGDLVKELSRCPGWFFFHTHPAVLGPSSALLSAADAASAACNSLLGNYGADLMVSPNVIVMFGVKGDVVARLREAGEAAMMHYLLNVYTSVEAVRSLSTAGVGEYLVRDLSRTFERLGMYYYEFQRNSYVDIARYVWNVRPTTFEQNGRYWKTVKPYLAQYEDAVEREKEKKEEKEEKEKEEKENGKREKKKAPGGTRPKPSTESNAVGGGAAGGAASLGGLGSGPVGGASAKVSPKPWYSYPTWNDLRNKGGEAACRAADEAKEAALETVPGDWKPAMAEVHKLSNLEGETQGRHYGTVNVKSGTAELGRARPDPGVFPFSPRVLDVPGWFFFFTRRGLPGLIPKPGDAVASLLAAYDGKAAGCVLFTPEGACLFGPDPALLNFLRKRGEAELQRMALDLYFMVAGLYSSKLEEEEGFSLAEVKTLLGSLRFFYYVLAAPGREGKLVEAKRDKFTALPHVSGGAKVEEVSSLVRLFEGRRRALGAPKAR